jgi:putative N6-adenine-specific DNA methylase
MHDQEYQMIAKTMYGLEEVLASELLKLGAKDIKELNRAVSFTGDKGFMYKANFQLRTALKILKPILHFTATDEETIYKEIKLFPWEQYIDKAGKLFIESDVNSSLFRHSGFISQKAKDAIADRFRMLYDDRPSIDKENPDLRIHIFIYENSCTISLDSSGISLHKRGYRADTNKAPINEMLAAGIILLSGWGREKNFIDPMCGSGTFLIEAALIGNNIPAGIFRGFAFEKWKDFDPELWKTITDSAIKKIRNDEYLKITGCDISSNVLRIAKENIRIAEVDDVVKVQTSSFESFEPPVGRGFVFLNPPYGERMDKDDIETLYGSIGNTLKRKYAGYEAWMITSNIEGLKFVGLRPSKKIVLFNGPLECRLVKYELYEGSKKGKKQNQESL